MFSLPLGRSHSLDVGGESPSAKVSVPGDIQRYRCDEGNTHCAANHDASNGSTREPCTFYLMNTSNIFLL